MHGYTQPCALSQKRNDVNMWDELFVIVGFLGGKVKGFNPLTCSLYVVLSEEQISAERNTLKFSSSPVPIIIMSFQLTNWVQFVSTIKVTKIRNSVWVPVWTPWNYSGGMRAPLANRIQQAFTTARSQLLHLLHIFKCALNALLYQRKYNNSSAILDFLKLSVKRILSLWMGQNGNQVRASNSIRNISDRYSSWYRYIMNWQVEKKQSDAEVKVCCNMLPYFCKTWCLNVFDCVQRKAMPNFAVSH